MRPTLPARTAQPHCVQRQLAAQHFFLCYCPRHLQGRQSRQMHQSRGCTCCCACSFFGTGHSCFSLRFFGRFFIRCRMSWRSSCLFAARAGWRGEWTCLTLGLVSRVFIFCTFRIICGVSRHSFLLVFWQSGSRWTRQRTVRLSSWSRGIVPRFQSGIVPSPRSWILSLPESSWSQQSSFRATQKLPKTTRTSSLTQIVSDGRW